MRNAVLNFLREEHAQDMVEYALVVGIIALACIVAMQGVATSVNNMWIALSGAIDDATTHI
jgi:Flp pilus assembly pilin Flp